MQNFSTLFARIKAAYDAIPDRDPDLICKHGFYGGCPVLKLQKAAWTDDDIRSVPNQCGVFFSIWLGEESLAKGRTNYNIHALKMRRLNKYKVTSRDFARAFRIGFESKMHLWPNVSVDYGPLTLMQGWIENRAESYEKDVLTLMLQFARLSPVIDRLLDEKLRSVE
jgi:hypothetical protein